MGAYGSMLGLVLGFSALGGAAARAEDVPEGVKPLLGAWKQLETEKVNLIRFEPRRMAQFRDGRLTFNRMHYEEGRLIRIEVGRKAPLEKFEVKDDVLILTTDKGVKVNFEKLAKDPPELVLRDVEFGKAEDVPADKRRDILKELAKREESNIKVRLEYRELIKDPADAKKKEAKFEEMEKIDADDTTYLIKLVKDVGWIDEKRFGDKANYSAYLIVMHTKDLSLMRSAIPQIEKEVKAKRFDPELFAGLHDRYRLIVAEPERYGMHVNVTEKGTLIVGPLEDRKKVDEFRKEIGLPPLAEYLKRYKEENGGKDVEVVDD
jgi:hypothetical protein